MALKVFVLENSNTKRKRQTDINNAVREYLNNPKAKVVYDEETGKATVEGAEKKIYISITCANTVMLVALYEKAIGIDGEYIPRVLDENNKVDYVMLADRFFSPEESEFMHETTRETEAETFLRIWVRKEAYVKAAGKTVAEFPKFSVVDGDRFLPKVNNITIKKFAIKFPDCDDYLFAIAGLD